MREQKKGGLYVSIHGHFYQPTRENPWTEEVEKQKAATPYHDWNELITYYCYLPNGSARVLDEKRRMVDIVNNYLYISFNFGPALFSWIKRKFPYLASSILQADQESARRNNGHGNAIAQVYNHMIMPLANERDKRTQVKWGVRYFEKEFGRYPEGIWLPETAINYPTVKVLIDFGIKFIILGSHQAQRVRSLEKDVDSWRDVSDGSIDTTRPYRLFTKDINGRRIQDKFLDVFFYHRDLSQAIAFQKILKNSAACADRIMKIFDDKKERELPLLVNIATDGETYGHHDPFSEMCLAHLVKYELPNRGVRPVNYPYFLEIRPPIEEVEIREGKNGEGTSWSCVHGVNRWKEDCGCNTGAHPEWNQKWRAPLRESLDWLRDRLVGVFEAKGKILFKEPWQARDDYIEVIMDRSPDNVTRFIQKHLKEENVPNDRSEALKLLEMQRFAMLMFTSCGWFFDELSGIEAVQNLKCAARAIQLAKELGGEDLEQEFLTRLSAARSNLKEFEDGRKVYEELVRPSQMNWQRACAHFLIWECLQEKPVITSSYQYRLEITEIREKELGEALLKVGKGKLISTITEELNEGIFFLAWAAKHRIYCFIQESRDEKEYSEVQQRLLSEDIELAPERLKKLASQFFRHLYTLKDLLPEDRENVLSHIIADEFQKIEEINESFFQDNVSMIRELVGLGYQMSPDILFFASQALNQRIKREVDGFSKNRNLEHLQKIKNIKDMADEFKIKSDFSPLAEKMEKLVLEKMKDLSCELDLETVILLRSLNQNMASLGIDYRRYEAQNELWKIIQKLHPLDKNKKSEQNKNSLSHLLLLAEDFGFSPELFIR